MVLKLAMRVRPYYDLISSAISEWKSLANISPQMLRVLPMLADAISLGASLILVYCLFFPVIERIRGWGCLLLVYIDDVLTILRRRHISTVKDCIQISRRIDALLGALGITKHPEKGYCGSGVPRALHLGFIFDTIEMFFLVQHGNQLSTKRKAKVLLREVCFGRRSVTMCSLSKFLGSTTALHPAVHSTRFYIRALLKSLNGTWRHVGRKIRVRLSCQAVRDLK